MKQTYEVSILGQKFVLKTENDEDRVKRVADYVNKVMHGIKTRSSTISTQNIAILGALNIAEELFSKDERYRSSIENWRDRLIDICSDEDQQAS
ncbi:MAG: cell division protein ZapA [Deltaproteobacteria bacterium]|nr:cell division protein ZapA [Deltaproteobacteria bacterium]